MNIWKYDAHGRTFILKGNFYCQLILTKLVLCLVGIGSSLKVVSGWRVSADERKSASAAFLLKLRDIQQYLTLRREMMYHLARGRFEELTSQK